MGNMKMNANSPTSMYTIKSPTTLYGFELIMIV